MFLMLSYWNTLLGAVLGHLYVFKARFYFSLQAVTAQP